jgi:DNA transformation protein
MGGSRGAIALDELATRPNLGPVIRDQLREIGIDTIEQLRTLGSEEAWLRLKGVDEST